MTPSLGITYSQWQRRLWSAWQIRGHRYHLNSSQHNTIAIFGLDLSTFEVFMFAAHGDERWVKLQWQKSGLECWRKVICRRWGGKRKWPENQWLNQCTTQEVKTRALYDYTMPAPERVKPLSLSEDALSFLSLESGRWFEHRSVPGCHNMKKRGLDLWIFKMSAAR